MEDFIRYKNCKVAYSNIGKGNAIVLLHGFLENSTMWNDITEELSKKNRIICVDLLGHGKSDCLGYIHTMENMAEAVKAVLKKLRIRRAIFIGHSMGGYAALSFAEKFPENIKGLCLLNSTAQADTEERKNVRLRACEMAQTNYQNLVKMSIINLFAPETRNLFSSEIEMIKNEALKTSIQGYISATKGMMLRTNKELVLKNINRKLIISGKNDPIINIEFIKKEAERTNTPIHFLENGHMSYIESKTVLLKTLKEFVK